VAGNIDIRAGVELEDSKDPQRIAIGAGRRADPRFDQQVQFNLSGLIGDKLNLAADWNTQRPFEFENQLKLGYRGYEDDIVQSIEAGNVALTLPTSLIGSSQALFGIKAKGTVSRVGHHSRCLAATRTLGRTKHFWWHARDHHQLASVGIRHSATLFHQQFLCHELG
jgi:cell surface protein SprA